MQPIFMSPNSFGYYAIQRCLNMIPFIADENKLVRGIADKRPTLCSCFSRVLKVRKIDIN